MARTPCPPMPMSFSTSAYDASGCSKVAVGTVSVSWKTTARPNGHRRNGDGESEAAHFGAGGSGLPHGSGWGRHPGGEPVEGKQRTGRRVTVDGFSQSGTGP